MEWERVVASNVRRLRKARGLTQEQLALRAEVAMRYVGMVERAEVSASVRILGQLAEVLEVSPAAFFDRTSS